MPWPVYERHILFAEQYKGFRRYLHCNWQLSWSGLQVTGLTLPGGGDVVVGQEYTDFDKGLDDGVEGDVFGFYLFRTAAPSARPLPAASELEDADEHQLLASTSNKRARSELSAEATRRGDGTTEPHRQHLADDATRLHLPDDAPRLHAHNPFRRAEAGMPMKRPQRLAPARLPRWKHNKRYSLYSPPKEFLRRVPLRVQRLYALCTDHLVPEDRADAVVAWPSTPVRVFGGAIISNVNSGCGDF